MIDDVNKLDKIDDGVDSIDVNGTSRWRNLNFKVNHTISVHKRMKMTSCIKLWLKTNSPNEYDKMENCDGSNYPMWMKLTMWMILTKWNDTFRWIRLNDKDEIQN